jgi:hypothetical protein
MGQTDHLAMSVEQSEVDSPRIDADAIRHAAVVHPAHDERLDDIPVEPGDIPVKAAVDIKRAVGKPVDLLSFEQTPFGESPEYRPSAFGTQVEGKVPSGRTALLHFGK